MKGIMKRKSLLITHDIFSGLQQLITFKQPDDGGSRIL
jgi:hypothetical protein